MSEQTDSVGRCTECGGIGAQHTPPGTPEHMSKDQAIAYMRATVAGFAQVNYLLPRDCFVARMNHPAIQGLADGLDEALAPAPAPPPKSRLQVGDRAAASAWRVYKLIYRQPEDEETILAWAAAWRVHKGHIDGARGGRTRCRC